MLELDLTKVGATLENISLRTEKVGPDKLPAADFKLNVPADVNVLAHFSPTLREFLFMEGPKDLLGDTGLAVRDAHMQYPLARDEEMSGATVFIGYGVGDPMHFPDCRINSFRLTPLDGGTVIVGMRVQCRPSPEQVAKLYQIQETSITLTIEPAELPEIKAA